MYEIHDNTDGLLHEGGFDFDQDLPEPLDHWLLSDFIDIVVPGRSAS
jgi:hypothetical protein